MNALRNAAGLAGAALSAALFAGAAQAACYEVGADGAQDLALLDDYVLVEASAEPGLMARPPMSEDAEAILCERETIVPDENDFEVLYHSPLYIRAGEGDDVQLLALAVVRGEDEEGEPTIQYQVQLPQGSINDDERAAIVAALEGFNEGEAALAEYMREQENGG